MNKLSLIAALLIASAGAAHADVTLEAAGGAMKAVVHTAGLNYGFNSNEQVQVDVYVSLMQGNRVERKYYAITGCDKEGGRVVVLDQSTGDSTGKASTWISGGPSFMDDIAYTTCAMATKAAEAELAALKESDKRASNKQSTKTAI